MLFKKKLLSKQNGDYQNRNSSEQLPVTEVRMRSDTAKFQLAESGE